MLANTFLNSKKAEVSGSGVKKSGRKKGRWDEKLVQKTAVNMSGTMSRFKEHQKEQSQQPKKSIGRVKSILKGCPNPGEDDE